MSEVRKEFAFLKVHIPPTSHWQGKTNGRARFFCRWDGTDRDVAIYIQGMGVSSKYRFTDRVFYCKLRTSDGKLKRYQLNGRWNVTEEPFEPITKSGLSRDDRELRQEYIEAYIEEWEGYIGEVEESLDELRTLINDYYVMIDEKKMIVDELLNERKKLRKQLSRIKRGKF
jgi:hypothetical protein